MMMNLLAEVVGAKAETMIPGSWITTFVVALVGAITAAYMKISGRREGLREATNNVTLQSPVPEVPTRKVLTPPSWDAHQALRDRVSVLESGLADLRRESISQYHELLKAGGERETHLSDKLDGIARSIHSRIDELLTTRPRPRP